MTDSEKLDRILALLEQKRANPASNAAAPVGGSVAPDMELDGPYGDPVVKNDPKKWEGPSFAGCKLSQCSPEFLEVYAGAKDYQAYMNDKEGKMWTSKKGETRPASTFPREEAAKARGWAQRMRNGWVPPVVNPPAEVDDSDIPF